VLPAFGAAELPDGPLEARTPDTIVDRAALAAELKAHVQSRLSKHKYPRWIVFVDDLPKNDRGKVDKKTLLEHEKRGQLVGE
jgi:acyl-coenzyme A synthetase/AMP-(fatty) acid ligase